MRLIMLFWKRFTIEIEDSNKQFFNATSSQCETLRIWWYSESLPRSLWRAINTQQTNFRIVIVAVLIDRGNSDKIYWPFESRNSHIAEKCSVSKTATVYKNVYVKNLKALTYIQLICTFTPIKRRISTWCDCRSDLLVNDLFSQSSWIITRQVTRSESIIRRHSAKCFTIPGIHNLLAPNETFFFSLVWKVSWFKCMRCLRKCVSLAFFSNYLLVCLSFHDVVLLLGISDNFGYHRIHNPV